jgi:hypothetical protein
MRHLIILLLIFITGCATTTPQVTKIRKYERPKLHHADCLIDNQRYSESNLMLVEETQSTYKVKASDGKMLGLPIEQCILSQVEREEGFSEDTPKQRWVKCALGKMSLVTDSLIYVDDERHYYRLKRKDGQIWVLPRLHCSIYSFPPTY